MTQQNRFSPNNSTTHFLMNKNDYLFECDRKMDSLQCHFGAFKSWGSWGHLMASYLRIDAWKGLLGLFYSNSTFDKCCKTKRFCLQGISAETKVSTSGWSRDENFFSFRSFTAWLNLTLIKQWHSFTTHSWKELNDCHEF